MKLLSILEELADTPSLKNKIEEVTKKNKLVMIEFKKNNIQGIRKLLSSQNFYANEIDIVRN